MSHFIIFHGIGVDSSRGQHYLLMAMSFLCCIFCLYFSVFYCFIIFISLYFIVLLFYFVCILLFFFVFYHSLREICFPSNVPFMQRHKTYTIYGMVSASARAPEATEKTCLTKPYAIYRSSNSQSRINQPQNGCSAIKKAACGNKLVFISPNKRRMEQCTGTKLQFIQRICFYIPPPFIHFQYEIQMVF